MKPPVTETAKEVTMAQGVKGSASDSAGVCDRCKREAPYREGVKGREGRYCVSCANMIRKCDRQGRPCPEYGTGHRVFGKRGGKPELVKAKPQKPPSAPQAPVASKEPRPAPKSQQRAAEEASAAFTALALAMGGSAPAGFAPLTAHALADALRATEEVRLLVTCRSVAAILAVVRAVECDADVMIGVAR